MNHVKFYMNHELHDDHEGTFRNEILKTEHKEFNQMVIFILKIIKILTL